MSVAEAAAGTLPSGGISLDAGVFSHLESEAVFAAADVQHGAVGSGAQAPHYVKGIKDLLWRRIAGSARMLSESHAAGQLTPLRGAS